MEAPAFDAIVLAGGSSRRLNGADKAMIDIAGTTLLDRSLAAVSDAGKIVCVGPQRPGHSEVIWTEENPPGSGPAAAIVAGLDLVGRPITVVLSVDNPFVDAALVERLARRCASSVGVVVTDGDGRLHPLIAAYPTDLLRASAAGLPSTEGASVAQLLSGVPYATLEDDDAARDCDTWDDIERAREKLG